MKYKESRKRIVLDLAIAIKHARTQWNNAFKIMRKIYLQIKLLYPAKLWVRLRVK